MIEQPKPRAGRFSNEPRPRAGHYRVSDIAKQIDRSTMAVLRWEKEGLIPKARRDSRGWRTYTKEQVEDIVTLVKNTKYFSK
jgi:DNA-binding transcriptional MerR regulator